MPHDTQYEAALDTAGKHAAFAVRPIGQADAPVARMTIALGRESAALLPAIMDRCASAQIPLAAITRWTVGMGPGSFTGIRMGAALAMGMVAGRPARMRGVPSGLLLLGSLQIDLGQRLAILNDGRRGQAIVSRFSLQANGFHRDAVPLPIGLSDLAALDVDRFILRSDDAMNTTLPAELEPRLTRLDTIDAAQLLAPAGFLWPADPANDAATVDPAYVRPAVFIPPAPPPLAV